MIPAVQNLQKALASGQPSLTRLLRQTLSIGAKLNLEDVEQWVALELNGYPEDAEPPDYRKVLTHSLEIYNAHRDVWQFAGQLNYALNAVQPMAEIENLSREDRVSFPVAKNFSIKNDLGDSFGSDWPQRFVVSGSQYQGIIKAVANRWTTEFEKRGLQVLDIQALMAALDSVTRSEETLT